MKPRDLINNWLMRWNYGLDKRSSFYTRHRRSALLPTFDLLMARVLMDKPKPYFVQVGAFDGKTEDFLFRHVHERKLPGILIEPQKEIFETLKGNFPGHDNLVFLNMAISEKDGRATLYRPLEGKDVTTMASLTKEQLQPLLDSPEHKGTITIDEYEVTVRRLEGVLDDQGMQAVDILQVDTEGHDDVVIYSANLKRFQPKLINYENIHLSRQREEKLWEHLTCLGYRLHVERFNTLALHESLT